MTLVRMIYNIAAVGACENICAMVRHSNEHNPVKETGEGSVLRMSPLQ